MVTLAAQNGLPSGSEVRDRASFDRIYALIIGSNFFTVCFLAFFPVLRLNIFVVAAFVVFNRTPAVFGLASFVLFAATRAKHGQSIQKLGRLI